VEWNNLISHRFGFVRALMLLSSMASADPAGTRPNPGPGFPSSDCSDPVAYYRADTTELYLPTVRLGSSRYTARLKLASGAPPLVFELLSSRPCPNGSSELSALPPVYDAGTGELVLPTVAVEFPDGRKRSYRARLRRTGTEPVRFELSRIEALPGELFTVEDTVYVNTLLGYGEIRTQTSYPTYNRSAASGGDILWGADLGLPVTLPGAGREGRDLTLYLFGDTDQLDRRWLMETGRVRKYRPENDQAFVGPAGPFDGDAIGLSEDDDPSDGIHLTRIYRNREPEDPAPVCDQAAQDGFRPVYLEGVHASPCVQILPNTTPTGAWSLDGMLFMLAGLQSPDDLANARSYLAVSTDRGLTWQVVNGGLPFSQGGPRARFIHGFGLEIDARDYQDMRRSGPCRLPLPAGRDTRGLLLFGTGLWKASDVYLAFIARTDLLAAAVDPRHRLQPWYFAGTDSASCWSRSESEAKAIIVAGDLSAYDRFEQACNTALVSAGVGYSKPIRVDRILGDGTRIDRLVMLLSPAYQGITAEGKALDADLGTVLVTGDPLRPWSWNLAVEPTRHDGRLSDTVHFRPLPVPAAGNSGLEPARPACRNPSVPWATVSGYAPLLIDRYTRLSADGKGIDLYFTISRWNVPKDPDDPGPRQVDAYHYVVDILRTTLRPKP